MISHRTPPSTPPAGTPVASHSRYGLVNREASGPPALNSYGRASPARWWKITSSMSLVNPGDAAYGSSWRNPTDSAPSSSRAASVFMPPSIRTGDASGPATRGFGPETGYSWVPPHEPMSSGTSPRPR